MPWVDESALDDPDALRALDTRDSLRSLASAGAQVRRLDSSKLVASLRNLDEAARKQVASTTRDLTGVSS